jgi:hypothetical protein
VCVWWGYCCYFLFGFNRAIVSADDRQTKRRGNNALVAVVQSPNNVNVQRSTRRLTVREQILEENLASQRPHLDVHEHRTRPDNTYNVKELLHRLQEDNIVLENMKMQVGNLNQMQFMF